MKVLLLADIRGIGRKNEIKEVSTGHANNLLFPKKLAIPATDQVLRAHAERAKKHAHEEAELTQQLREIATRIESRTLVFPVKTNAEGTVFGSITKDMILSGLRAEHVLGKEHVDIKIDHPLKAVGDYVVKVDLKKGVTAKLTVTLKAAKE
jgi:large subunit ribosomal protein L9